MAKAKVDLLRGKFNGFDVFNYIFMFLFAFVTIFPLYYVFIVSVATPTALKQHLIYILPYAINFSAYGDILKDALIPNSFFISIFITVTTVILSTLICTASAYVLSKRQIPGAKFFWVFVMIPMFFGGGLIPYYLTMKSLGLINNILILIIPSLMDTFTLILYKNFFEQLPASVEESAKIDGASDVTILYKIVLPMSTPVVATMALFCAVGKWNDWFTGMLYIQDDYLKPLQLVLRNILVDFSNVTSSTFAQQIMQNNSTSYVKTLQMAVIIITIVPIFCCYPFAQKYFTQGIVLGAVKE